MIFGVICYMLGIMIEFKFWFIERGGMIFLFSSFYLFRCDVIFNVFLWMVVLIEVKGWLDGGRCDVWFVWGSLISWLNSFIS